MILEEQGDVSDDEHLPVNIIYLESLDLEFHRFADVFILDDFLFRA